MIRIRPEMALVIAAGAMAIVVGCSSEGEKLSPDPSVATSTGSSSDGGSGGSGGTGGDSATTSSSGAGGDGTGGGGSMEETAGFVSGSRLRAKYIEGSDGSKQFVSFYDSQIGSDCTFRNSEEGVRCLPTVTVPNFDFPGPGSFSTLYSDAACTIKAPKVVASCSGTPTHVTEANGCLARGTHAVTGTVPAYYLQSSSCLQHSIDEVWTTQPVPLTDWVTGTTMTE